MSDAKLKRLSGLTDKFNKAITKRYGSDPVVGMKIMSALKPGEQEKAADLAQEVAMATMWGNTDDETLKKNIAMNELGVDIFLRVVPAAELAQSIPAKMKNQDDADALRALGAPKLASLCELK